ncbi:hypothetical protein, partial [Rhodoferax sp.]|uniref:hypothetical protein n=1 Tax=Rhodoferax sp. TaxID=50421 RepID=UPI00179A48CD
MQGANRETIAHSDGRIDTQAALWLLGSLAGFYRQPFDAELVTKRFAPPFDLPTLIEALEALGLKAGLAPWPQDDWASLPLPAVVFLAAQDADTSLDAGVAVPDSASAATVPSPLTPALIVKHADHTLAWVRPGQARPEPVSADVARAQCVPVMLLVMEAEPPLTESTSQAENPAEQKKSDLAHRQAHRADGPLGLR